MEGFGVEGALMMRVFITVAIVAISHRDLASTQSSVADAQPGADSPRRLATDEAAWSS
jgi:hypothetical protein